jgi:L-ribulose-5-phosphate 3-epimerase
MMKYTLGCYEKSMPNKLTIKEKLSYVKQFGFDFMELSIDESDEKLSRLDWDSSHRSSILNDMANSGSKIGSICLSGHRRFPLGSENQEVRNKSLEIMRKAISLADDLGIHIIQIAGYDEYYQESNNKTKEYFLANLEKSVVWASEKAVILALETMETPFMDTVEKALHYVRLINSPYLQIYPDTGNFTNGSQVNHGDVISDLEIGIGHIVAIHLKESLPGIFREVPFGEGHVQFDRIIEYGLQCGVRRYNAEFWCADEKIWMSQMENANNFLTEKLDRHAGNLID